MLDLGGEGSGARDHDAAGEAALSRVKAPPDSSGGGGSKEQPLGPGGTTTDPGYGPGTSSAERRGSRDSNAGGPRGLEGRRGGAFLAVVTGDLNSGCRSLPWFRLSQDCAVVCLVLPGAGRGEGQGTPFSPWPFKAICSHLLSTPKDVSLQGPLPTLPGILVHSIWPLVTPRASPASPLLPAPLGGPSGGNTAHPALSKYLVCPRSRKNTRKGAKASPRLQLRQTGRNPKETSVPCPAFSGSLPEPWSPHLSLDVGGSPALRSSLRHVLAASLWWGHSREAPTPLGPASSCITGRPGSGPLDA